MAEIVGNPVIISVGQETVAHVWIHPWNESRHILGPTIPGYGLQLHWGYTGTRRWYTLYSTDHFMVRVKCLAVNVPGNPEPPYTSFQIVYADL